MAGKPAPEKERAWAKTELKYLVLVLADKKNQFAVRLEIRPLKKSANNDVFKDISKLGPEKGVIRAAVEGALRYLWAWTEERCSKVLFTSYENAE